MNGYFVRILLFVRYLWYNDEILAVDKWLWFVALGRYLLV